MREPSDIGFEYGGLLRERAAPSPAQIEQIESRVGAALPDDYKAFLARQNGGAPIKSFLEVGHDDGFILECLNYVDGAKADIYDVEKASRWPSEELAEQVVAIAADGSGDQLILRRLDGTWRVQWWRHDEVPSTTDVAATFSEFLEKLTHPPQD